MQRIGRHSERVKELRRSIRKRPPGVVIVDGRRLVADLIRWQVPIRDLYISEELAGQGAGVDLCLAAGNTWVLADPVLEEISPTRTPQGVLAVAAEPEAWPWPADSGVTLLLEGVQDPGNLGAIVRSAAALGAAGVLLAPGCADPFSPSAVRGSAGAVFRLPPRREVPVEEAVAVIRGGGGWVQAAAAGGQSMEGWFPQGAGLLLLGAEGAGLAPETLALADGRVTIPLDRQVESLNVAVAAGILLQHLRTGRP